LGNFVITQKKAVITKHGFSGAIADRPAFSAIEA
jgi:hypothetical protein